jgi:MFS family permease
MGRIILGVIVGFIAWSILWVGGDEALATLMPEWYGTHKLALEKAAFNNTPFEASSIMLAFHLIRSVITSLLSGFLAAFVANENRRTTMILGVLLLIIGIIFQAMVWNLLPIWYHLAFLFLLIPVTIAGGYLKKTT